MLIVCSSCNSKYLVNSADLKPNGRKVQCSKCNHNWFQTSNIDAEETLESSVPSTQSKTSRNNESQINSNLPSTFIMSFFFSLPLGMFRAIVMTFPLRPSISRA